MRRRGLERQEEYGTLLPKPGSASDEWVVLRAYRGRRKKTKSAAAKAEVPSSENGAAKQEYQTFVADLGVLSSKFVPRVSASVQMIEGQQEFVFLTALQPAEGEDALVVGQWAVTWQHFQRMYVLFRRILMRHKVDLLPLDLKAKELEKDVEAILEKARSKA